jgi:hypothetical protein
MIIESCWYYDLIGMYIITVRSKWLDENILHQGIKTDFQVSIESENLSKL